MKIVTGQPRIKVLILPYPLTDICNDSSYTHAEMMSSIKIH
ncbi:hypothetical protein rpr22_0922 [Rickettsia prowazekii str. Rp22]|uniref:Uncharacterized protein n=1 Tax=Rickettsia prowazekii (strain Rp22) TaxID=449216 RepID=D5AYE3_RICPP|nr:hypothetical protein rpr22_0922 [Rickettsia prowazekii str. Rp22]